METDPDSERNEYEEMQKRNRGYYGNAYHWKTLMVLKGRHPNPPAEYYATNKQAKPIQTNRVPGRSRFAPIPLDDEGNEIIYMTPSAGQIIQKARQQRNLKQVDLAKLCNLDSKVIQQYEKGEGMYDRDALDAICNELNIVINKRMLLSE